MTDVTAIDPAEIDDKPYDLNRSVPFPAVPRTEPCGHAVIVVAREGNTYIRPHEGTQT